MMRLALGARDRRALRIGAWVAAPILLATLVVLPYARALRAARQEVATQRELLAREQALLRDVPRDASRARADARALLAHAGRLFDGADPAAASAALASYVGDAAEAAALTLEGSETRAPAADDSIVAVEIRALTEAATLVDLLVALEEGPKLVHVERLAIARAAGRRAAGDPPMLSAAATISGPLRRTFVGPLAAGRAEASERTPAVADAWHALAAGDVVLDTDPFDPERRSPGYFDVVEEAAGAVGPPRAAPRLLGVVVLPGERSFAVCQLPSERPRTIRVGESLGDLVLEAVMPGHAVFRAPDGARIELHLSAPGA